MTGADIAIWTSAVAAAGVVASAAVTGYITYRLTQRSINANTMFDENRRQHEIIMSRTERDQSRKFDAYLSVTRYVRDWIRQIEFVIAEGISQFDPPRQQPGFDTGGYGHAEEAQVALVGSRKVQLGLTDFNKQLNIYLVSRGIARELGNFVSQQEPASVRVAATSNDEADEKGRIALKAGQSLIDLMRVELEESESRTALNRRNQSG